MVDYAQAASHNWVLVGGPEVAAAGSVAGWVVGWAGDSALWGRCGCLFGCFVVVVGGGVVMRLLPCPSWF